MDLKDFRKLAGRVREDADMMRRIIEKEASDARMLIDQDIHREFADELLKIGADIQTAEVKWRYFGKVAPSIKKMAIIQK